MCFMKGSYRLVMVTATHGNAACFLLKVYTVCWRGHSCVMCAQYSLGCNRVPAEWLLFVYVIADFEVLLLPWAC
jgi:hypothetical protein